MRLKLSAGLVQKLGEGWSDAETGKACAMRCVNRCPAKGAAGCRFHRGYLDRRGQDTGGRGRSCRRGVAPARQRACFLGAGALGARFVLWDTVHDRCSTGNNWTGHRHVARNATCSGRIVSTAMQRASVMPSAAFRQHASPTLPAGSLRAASHGTAGLQNGSAAQRADRPDGE